MKKIFGAAAVLFLSVFLALAPMGTSVAQEAGPFYVGVFGGYTFGSELELEGHRYPYYAGDLDVQETWVAGAKFGYTLPFAKYLAMEFEYKYFGSDIDRTVLYSAGSDFSALEGDVDVHSYLFNFIAKYPEGKIHPFVGVGVGFSYVDVSATTTSRESGRTYTYAMSHDTTAFAWQLLAGINFEINKNFTVDLTYRYFVTSSDGDEDYDWHYEDSRYGLETEIKASMVTVGLNFHF